MNKVFKAISDPTRRKVLELLKRGPKTAGDLCEDFSVSKPTMSAHFAILREANLVETEKHGRVILYRLRMSVLEDALLGFVHAVGLGIDKNKTGSSKNAHRKEKHTHDQK